MENNSIEKNRDLILNGNLYKLVIKLSLPLMLSNLIQTVYSLTDTYFVSKIGDNQVAAIGFVWPIVFLYMALGLGLTMGAKAIISQHIGAGDEQGAIEVAGQTFSFISIVSVVIAVIGIIICPWIIKTMGGEGIIYTEGVAYCRIILAGMPLMYFYFAFQAVKHAEGDMITPMMLSIGAVVLNMLLDPLFILVFHWGVKGAAYATTLSRLAALFIVIVLIVKNKHTREHKALKHLKLKKSSISEILKIGAPTAVGRITTSLGFMIMNAFVVSFGAHVLTAYVIGNQIISLVMMPSMGIGSATTTIIGQNIGANQIDRAKKALQKTLIVALAFSIAGLILLFIFKADIIGVFTKSKAVLESGIRLTDIVALSLPLMAVFQVMSGFFIGTKNTMQSMIADIVRLWVLRIPLIILFKYVFHMDEYSIWYPILISTALADVLFAILYMTKRWQIKPKVK